MQDDIPGLGIVFLWQLPDTHPLHEAGVWHDLQYDLRKAGQLDDPTSERIDKEFYWRCMAIAIEQQSEWLIFESRLFYPLVRTWGKMNWPKPPPKTTERQPHACKEKTKKATRTRSKSTTVTRKKRTARPKK